MEARLYQELEDLLTMLDLLSEGRRANTGTYYIHRGDLQWWLFYNDDISQAWKSDIRLWEDENRLLGFAFPQ